MLWQYSRCFCFSPCPACLSAPASSLEFCDVCEQSSHYVPGTCWTPQTNALNTDAANISKETTDRWGLQWSAGRKETWCYGWPLVVMDDHEITTKLSGLIFISNWGLRDVFTVSTSEFMYCKMYCITCFSDLFSLVLKRNDKSCNKQATLTEGFNGVQSMVLFLYVRDWVLFPQQVLPAPITSDATDFSPYTFPFTWHQSDERHLLLRGCPAVVMLAGLA